MTTVPTTTTRITTITAKAVTMTTTLTATIPCITIGDVEYRYHVLIDSQNSHAVIKRKRAVSGFYASPC